MHEDLECDGVTPTHVTPEDVFHLGMEALAITLDLQIRAGAITRDEAVAYLRDRLPTDNDVVSKILATFAGVIESGGRPWFTVIDGGKG